MKIQAFIKGKCGFIITITHPLGVACIADKIMVKHSNPYQDRVDVAKSLFGIIPDEMTLEEAREERLGKM